VEKFKDVNKYNGLTLPSPKERVLTVYLKSSPLERI
jgi:hypothetical protein